MRATGVSLSAGTHCTLQNVTNPHPEEPCAFIGLVRTCGGRRLAFGPGGPIPEAVGVSSCLGTRNMLFFMIFMEITVIARRFLHEASTRNSDSCPLRRLRA